MLPFNEEERLSQLALTLIDGVGPKMSRILFSHFGSASAVFQASLKELKAINGMGEQRARACKAANVQQWAARELAYVQKHDIELLFFTDTHYPSRLKQCDDAPMLLYYKGEAVLNATKMVAVVGTRKNTDYGLRMTEQLVEDLRNQDDLVIVSGLAFGIDAAAHKKCCQLKMPTVGVVAHGLNKMYPSSHQHLAKEMLEQGGLLSEFPSGTAPDKQNFPLRNRIVAGMCDVTVVAESDEKGGAMITAYVAASYNREVAAFPGRTIDSKSSGPNKLIQKNIASLITSGQDLADIMNWSTARPSKKQQQSLFQELSEDEQTLINALEDVESIHTDDLMLTTGLSTAKIGALLLQLEMIGLVKALPGKRFRMA